MPAPEHYLKIHVGDLVFKVSLLQSEMAALAEENSKLKAELVVLGHKPSEVEA